MIATIAFDGGEWELEGEFKLRQRSGQWALVLEGFVVEGNGLLGLPTLQQVGAVVTVSHARDGEVRVLQDSSVKVIDERSG